MNSNLRNQLIIAITGAAALLVGVNQYASQRQLRALQREVGQLQAQLDQQETDHATQVRRTAALRLNPEDLEARIHRHRTGEQSDQIGVETHATDAHPALGHGLARALSRFTSRRHERVPQNASTIARFLDTADTEQGLTRLSEAELDTMFAGMGVPPPGPVASGGVSLPSQGQAQAEEAASRPAQRVEKGGVLLRRGKLQIEPVISYSHLSNNRVALSGFSVFDVVFIGEIRSDQVKRDIITSSLNARYGITNNLQAEFEAPMQYQHEEVMSGPVESRKTSTNTHSGLSDLGAGLFYQFAGEHDSRPSMIAHVKVKAPTGSIPIGTGGWGLQGSLIMMKTSDPVVLFSSIGYTLNFPITVGNAQVNPGDSFQYSVGIAYALNYNLGLNASFEQSFIGESSSAGSTIAGSRLVVANLKTGVTYALTKNLSLDFSVATGLTSDSPDLTVAVSLPYTF